MTAKLLISFTRQIHNSYVIDSRPPRKSQKLLTAKYAKNTRKVREGSKPA